MARDEFISDRLVDMREHLKRNYEKFHSTPVNESTGVSDIGIPDEKTENMDVLPVKNENIPDVGTPVNLRYMPSIGRKNGDDAVLRRSRELEGKVIHDLAYSESTLDLLEKKVAELKKFHAFLKKSHEKLLQMADNGDYSTFDEINTGYHAAHGRWQAFESAENGSKVPVTKNAERSGNYAAFMIAGAIVAGCVLLSAVLLILFS